MSLSNYEGFSRVLLEAIYVGLYVVAYNNNGTKYIENFENTVLLNSKNQNNLEDTINKILSQEIFISKQNREQVEISYSTKEIASQFAKIYTKKEWRFNATKYL